MYIVAAVLLFTACKPTVPSQFIQPGDMEDLLVDYHIAMAMAANDDRTGEKRAYNENLYFAAVLEKHGYTKAEFDSSLTYYYTRADRFSGIYKNVAKRLTEQPTGFGAPEGEVTRFARITKNGGDTVDVWRGELSMMLIPYAPYNRYDFEQKADTSFRRGDSFAFIVQNDFVYQSGSHTAHACIVMRYDNDSIVSRDFSLTSSGINQIRVPNNGNHMVKDIRGFIYLAPDNEKTTTLKLMLIRNIQLIKFRKQKSETAKSDTLKSDTLKTDKRKTDTLKTDTLKTKQL